MWIQCTQVSAPFHSKHIQIQKISASRHPESFLPPHIYFSQPLGCFAPSCQLLDLFTDGERATALLCRVGLQWQWTCLQWRIVQETHTHTPEVTLLFLDSNNMAAALLSIGREKSFSVHQVQSWSAKKQLKLEVKLEGSQGQVGILPFHHRDYHLLLHQGPLSADTDVQRLVFSE